MIQQEQLTAIDNLDTQIREDMNTQLDQIYTIIKSHEKIEELTSLLPAHSAELLPSSIAEEAKETSDPNSEEMPKSSSRVIKKRNKIKTVSNPGLDNSEELSKEFSFRITNLEKKLEDIFPSNLIGSTLKSSIRELNIENPKEKDDFIHEFHLRYVVLLKEFNQLKELFSVLKPRDQPSDKLVPERVPNYSQYLPYMNRIQNLEDLIKNIMRENPQTYIQSEIEQINDQLKLKANSQDIAELIQKIQNERSKETVIEKVREIDSKILSPKANETLVQPTNITEKAVEVIKPSESLESSIRDLYEAVNKINRTLSLKMFRTELEEIFKTSKGLKPETMNLNTGQSSSIDAEKIAQFQSHLNICMLDSISFKQTLEKIQKTLTDEIPSQIISITEECNEHTENIKLDYCKKLRDLRNDIFNPEKKTEIQSVEVLRNLIFRVQKESAECKEKLIEIENMLESRYDSKEIEDQNFIPPEVFPEEPQEEMPSVQMPQLKNLSNVLQKHDSLFKQVRNQMAKLAYDLEQSQNAFKKQNEINISNNLHQLEELKHSISDVMLKLREGSRLSQSDLNKLSELYTLVENKGDKQEITNKVDKQDLKKAYRFLTKRIELLHKELIKSEETRLVNQSHDDPALFRKKLRDFECLSCGQEVKEHKEQLTSKREWRPNGKFPGHTIKIGPGFSRVLPVLSPSVQSEQPHKNLVDFLNARTQDLDQDSSNTSLPKVARNRSTRTNLSIK